MDMDEKKYIAYVGTYTNGSSKGIHLYDVDVQEGTLLFRKVVPVNNCSHMALSKNGSYLYSISDEGIQVFRVCIDGDLESVNTVNINGMRATHICTSYEGKYLYCAGYHDGKVTVIKINEDGTLGDVIASVFHKPTGTVAERNFRPHVCCVRPTPDDKYFCAVDSGIDRVVIYQVNEGKKRLEQVEILRMQRDSGPRAVRFSKNGRFMYVLCELQNQIEVYSYDGSGKYPVFGKIQEISTLSKGGHERDYDAAQHLNMSPDKEYLYCTTAGENTLSLYKIDDETGLLEKRFTLPVSGVYPKRVVPFPDGRHVAVANNSSNTVTTFTIDYEKNTLIMKGRPQKVDQPNSIVFKEIKE